MIRESFQTRPDYRAGELAEAEEAQADERCSFDRLPVRSAAMIAGTLAAALWLVIALGTKLVGLW